LIANANEREKESHEWEKAAMIVMDEQKKYYGVVVYAAPLYSAAIENIGACSAHASASCWRCVA